MTEKRAEPQLREGWRRAAAVLFAFFMVFGRSFEQTDSWNLVFGSAFDLLLALVQGAGWFVVFDAGIKYLFRWWDRTGGEGPASTWKALALLERCPGRTAFATLLLFHLPCMILSYPAVFMGDTVTQVSQALGAKALTNHHPVMHTLSLSFFLRAGQLLGSDNTGIFLYSLTQTLLLCAAISYAVSVLAKVCANRLLTGCVLLYYCVHPRISSYFFLVTKDVPYTAFMTLFYVLLFQFLRGGPLRKREYVLFGISIAGMLCFRNDGQYVVLLTLLAALLCRTCRRRALAFLGVTAAVMAGIQGILLPLTGAAPGSIREMLSVPFQQTARYVRDAGEDVTGEEMAVIDQVLDYDMLAENYDPDLSDNVKATYRNSEEALPHYARVWLQMLLRHPGIYVQATMNNYYQYFYPGETPFNYYSYNWGEGRMELVNSAVQTDFHFPEALREARLSLEALREDIYRLPVLSLLNTPALYTWAALLFLAYSLRRKNLPGFLYGVPMIAQMLIFITGPTNGSYCRYEYPMLVYLPVVLALGLRLMRNPRPGQADDAA